MIRVRDNESLLVASTETNRPLTFTAIQQYLFLWVYRLLKIGKRSPLTQQSLYTLSMQDQSINTYFNFLQYITKPLVIALVFCFWKIIFTTFLMYFLICSLQSMLPYFMDKAQQYFKDGQINDQFVSFFVFAGIQFIYFLIQSLVQPYVNFQSVRISVKIQGVLQQRIFQKTLRFPIYRSKKYNSGDLINMLQVDIMQASNYYTNYYQVLVVPVQLIVSGIVFYQTVGTNSIAPGIGAAIQAFFGLMFGYLYGKIQTRFMLAKDDRMGAVDEALLHVKQIKLNGLEEYFNKRIRRLRTIELKYLKYQIAMLIFVQFFQNVSSLGSWEITFLLADSINFQTIALMMQNYSGIITILQNLPIQLKSYYASQNSMERIQIFLNQPELTNISQLETQSEEVLIILDGKFSWESIEINPQPNFQIKVNLNVKRGKLIAIVGNSASGKSTILGSILGETKQIAGSIQINGTISLATQVPWILNDSIRNNITYMEEYDEQKYKQVIHACALNQDINQFQFQDQTILGEKGDNLSGGQQKRINLARCVYKDADLYLLDDPLSALDIKTKCHIFQECLIEYLAKKEKTVIIFTNSFAHLSQVDEIYQIENGELIQYCPQKQTIQHQNQLDKKEKIDLDFESTHYLETMKQQNQELNCMKEEDQAVGGVNKKILKQIFIYQGGWWALFILVTYFLTVTGFQIFGNFALTVNNVGDIKFKDLALIYYPLIYLPIFIAYLYNAAYFLLMGIKTSKIIHNQVFNNLMKASVTKFYNSILIGRLMNRLSKDIYNIGIDLIYLLDLLFPNQLNNLIIQIVAVLMPLISSIVFLNIITLPLLILFIAILLYLTMIYYTCLRELTRIEAVSKSPIFSFFQQILRGISYARTCISPIKLEQTHSRNVDLDLGNQINLSGLQQWFSQTAGIITNIFQTLLFILCYLFPGKTQEMTYLILIQMSNVSQLLVTVATSYGNVLMYAISFERCLHLSKNIECEEYDSFSNQFNDLICQIPKNPIILNKCSFKYKPNSKTILQNISFALLRGEKIGVVGRTGAGKSSVILALTRMIEQSSGTIEIENKNISQYCLQELRSQFSIIPQDPLIFRGTLRDNLDPWRSHSEQSLIEIGKQCGLWELENFQQDRLNSQISGCGNNLSQGEKQLVSIVRCVLEKRQIILVDEATANIDGPTEEMIKNLFYQQFDKCTMITIAHKITTIMQSDRIMVLNEGEITEFDSPTKLLHNPDSEFKQILDLINYAEIL